MSSSIQTIVGSRLTVGLSSIVGVTVQASLSAWQLKNVTGGTLEIGLTAGQTTWGADNPVAYIMQAGEIVNVLGPGTFYIAASGATCVAHILKGFNS